MLLLQETLRGKDQNRPKINGMKLILERPHNKYEIATFVKKNNFAVTYLRFCTHDGGKRYTIIINY